MQATFLGIKNLKTTKFACVDLQTINFGKKNT